ncbi:YkvA family protein [soil metagenome]
MRTLIVVAVAIALGWLVFVIWLGLARPKNLPLRDAARFIPDSLRLLHRLARDPDLPRRTRWMVWGLLGYLASPIDLVPDFIPVIGYADDVILVALVLRHLVRKAGSKKLKEHWPGTNESLATLSELMRLPADR